jgi:predicted dehydrogenase/threonine dehydrogenase-like Zn-dependent dehydrogenase
MLARSSPVVRTGQAAMKAVTQNLQTGKATVEEISPPALRPEGILVRVRRSLISLGTERAALELAGESLAGKARRRPDLVQKVLQKARQEGLWNTIQTVHRRLNTPVPAGYSCAGEVLAVGEEATEFRVGERVACAGLGYANHAEVNFVPRNLAVQVPEGLSYDDACFVTVGAIAMQGVRLANLQLGHTVVVLGLGLVGQVAAQLARCSGAKVVATDLDRAKVELAAGLGAHHAVGESELDAVVRHATAGYGADAVLVCAAAKSSAPLARAAALARLKGRVVVVGDVGMELDRRAFFEKEIELVVSRSYGPGRYDPAYEARGVDYPLPYVRWTEQRNMQSFLELLGRGSVRVAPLVTHRFPIAQAESAYRIVTGEAPEPAIAILLEYEGSAELPSRVDLPAAKAPKLAGPLRLGVIGAGQFAKAVLLPAFAAHKQVQIDAVATSSGLTAGDVGRRYGARFCTSNAAEIIADPAIDAVLIATRHDQHAPLAASALRAGKAVFVEKPLAIALDPLLDVLEAVRESSAARLFVGYNRRFSPFAAKCREFFAGRAGPLLIHYRVNAGSLPPDHWALDPRQGGGRILGEVCHFVDFLCALTSALPQRIFAESLPGRGRPPLDRDSVSVVLRMSDGSVGTIQYVADGDPSVAKEYVEVFGGQRAAILDNYKTLTLHRDGKTTTHRQLHQAKGHAEEIAAFVAAVLDGTPMPIDMETLVAVTQTTLLIHASLDLGQPVEYQPPR